MPTYEFRCPEGHDFERFYRSIGTAEGTAACPTCGKVGARMMSATGFAFKGSGFYLTDYGKNAHRGEAAPSKGGDGASSESSASPQADGGGESAAAKPETTKAAETTTKPAAPKQEAPRAEPKPAPAKKPSAE